MKFAFTLRYLLMDYVKKILMKKEPKKKKIFGQFFIFSINKSIKSFIKYFVNNFPKNTL